MKQIKQKKKFATLFVLSTVLIAQLNAHSGHNHDHADHTHNTPTNSNQVQPAQSIPRIISDIIVTGNVHISTRTIISILKRLGYSVGQPFKPLLTRTAINTLYYELNFFGNISLYVRPRPNNELELHVVLEEMYPLKEVIIEDNRQLSRKDIDEKINFADIPAIDAHRLKMIAQQIKNLYIERGYHATIVDSELQVDSSGAATAIFTITECRKSLIKRISFCGNENVSSKTLRSIIYSREDWLLSFMDKAGIYQVDRLEGDKQMIEQYYQNHGYLNARVIDVIQEVDPCTQNFSITFDIDEGAQYCISNVSVSGENLIPEQNLLARIPLWPGMMYSRQRVVDTISVIEAMWGNFGYIFAHVDPSIVPNDEDKTVSISFSSDLGNQIYLNRITVRGNRKTRDRIIRRQLTLEEGGLLCTNMMESSKNRIESLGYFDVQDGVNWKTTRLDDDLADLELVVKEAKTGNASFQLSLGGSETTLSSPLSGIAVEFSISDTNLFGEGIRFNAVSKISRDEKTFLFNFTEPWLFNKPIFGALDFYHQRYSYDEFKLANAVHERHTGGSITTGFVLGYNHALLADTYFRFTSGIESLSYNRRPRAIISNGLTDAEIILSRSIYDTLLCKMFDPGVFGWLAVQIGQDKKNHPMHPSNGYAWTLRSYTALPTRLSRIAFNKIDFDAHYFTPLIGAYDLVFHLHGNIGLISPFNNRVVPYNELFHIGGPASVRGFKYGEIGPQFCVRDVCDSIGATRAFFVNAELIFAITQDLTMKGVLFYDGGAGWKNPYTNDFVCEVKPDKTVEFFKIRETNLLRNNGINYRHSVGFGIRMLNPVPLRIDWGFKLDKRPGESGHEVHFNMSYDW